MLSCFDRLRELTGLEQDGVKLIDTMFSIDRPLLVLNGLCTDSEKSEHKCFATLLKGISVHSETFLRMRQKSNG